MTTQPQTETVRADALRVGDKIVRRSSLRIVRNVEHDPPHSPGFTRVTTGRARVRQAFYAHDQDVMIVVRPA